MKALLVLLLLAILVGAYVVYGWLVTIVVGWFGADLSLLQGIAIAVLLSVLTGGGVARDR